MNIEKFSELLNELPDDMIESAVKSQYERKPYPLKLMTAMAACLVIGITAALWPILRTEPPERREESSYTTTTVTEETTSPDPADSRAEQTQPTVTDFTDTVPTEFTTETTPVSGTASDTVLSDTAVTTDTGTDTVPPSGSTAQRSTETQSGISDTKPTVPPPTTDSPVTEPNDHTVEATEDTELQNTVTEEPCETDEPIRTDSPGVGTDSPVETDAPLREFIVPYVRSSVLLEEAGQKDMSFTFSNTNKYFDPSQFDTLMIYLDVPTDRLSIDYFLYQGGKLRVRILRQQNDLSYPQSVFIFGIPKSLGITADQIEVTAKRVQESVSSPKTGTLLLRIP